MNMIINKTIVLIESEKLLAIMARFSLVYKS